MTESYKKRLLEYGEELKKMLEKFRPTTTREEELRSFLWRLTGYIEGLKEEKEDGLKCKKD